MYNSWLGMEEHKELVREACMGVRRYRCNYFQIGIEATLNYNKDEAMGSRLLPLLIKKQGWWRNSTTLYWISWEHDRTNLYLINARSTTKNGKLIVNDSLDQHGGHHGGHKFRYCISSFCDQLFLLVVFTHHLHPNKVVTFSNLNSQTFETNLGLPQNLRPTNLWPT